MRGDYASRFRLISQAAGPSPRAWGLPSPSRTGLAALRAIPTCVGTTGTTADPIEEDYGPSPHAWGLRPQGHPNPLRRRAIPTCVGTNGTGRSGAAPRPVHPHERGDYAFRSETLEGILGPSPRAWGLRLQGLQNLLGQRSIPTCVGTTAVLYPRHGAEVGPSPRAWGLLRVFLAFIGTYGPSPHAWGLRYRPLPGTEGPRAIPTCVGTTESVKATGGVLSGHPHVCGDYVYAPSPANASVGPSPRVWGLRTIQTTNTAQRRAIPTCVGTTLDQDGKNTSSPPVMCLSGR